MTAYGPANPNYRHGGYSAAPEVGDVKTALAKDLLYRVLTTPCDSGGNSRFTNAENAWAMRVAYEYPDWAADTLLRAGFKRGWNGGNH